MNKLKGEPTEEDSKKAESCEVAMSALLEELYFDKKIVNNSNVSVQSAFICLLHLANEQGLIF